MSFQIFECPDLGKLDEIVKSAPVEVATLKKLAAEIGEALPLFLVQFIRTALKTSPGTLAIHTSSSIENYKGADQEAISRTRGFIGNPQLEPSKFPNARHHVKILHNGKGKARVFYKNPGGVQFVQNQS